MNLIDRNIDSLSRNPNHWIGELTTNDGISFGVVGVEEDGDELFLIDDQVVKLKSDFDTSNSPNLLKRQLVFSIGIYSVDEIRELIRAMSQESLLIIVEPNLPFFNYTLHNKNLDFFSSSNVILFADNLNNFPLFLDKLFSTNAIFYLKNISFYFTHFYRDYDVESSISVVKEIRNLTQYKMTTFGNSIEDSLTGFRHNMSNIRHLPQSKNVSHLKRKFDGVPAIVVAAGPSLNKNLEQLKQVKDKAVIIAVDTIAQRLCDEGIVPDFICSIEREIETYNYFYENKNYPKETSIVAPLLLYPKIFEEFNGDLVIPMRDNVGEYMWLQQIFGMTGDNSISIGLSCAHVAFGFAEYIGASPIILLGQDLAFGESLEQSHAGGTIYDNKNFANEVFSSIEKTYTEGYFGGQVLTTDIWNSFRLWFETEIAKKDIFVINATEGGARISNTVPMSLKEASQKYCTKEIALVKAVLQSVVNYPLDLTDMKLILEKEQNDFHIMKSQFKRQLEVVEKLKITKRMTNKEMMNVLQKLSKTDPLFLQIRSNLLLRHNLQPVLLNCLWDLYGIEQTLSVDNLIRNREVQLEFLKACVFVLGEIVTILEESLNTI